jgi:hypothetical protein
MKYYETHLSKGKWLTLGLLSDAGWIAYFGGLALYMINGAGGLGTVALSALFLLNCLAVVAVAAGIIALISQRIRKLGRRLTRGQLCRSFGLVIYGSLAGFLCSTAAVVIDLLFGFETGICFVSQIIMGVGALLCFAFGLPIMKSFRPAEGA